MALDGGFASIAQITQSAAGSSIAKPGQCSMCKKTGLPILPVRYSAVAATKAHDISGLPKLMGSTFGDKVVGVAAKKANYVLRSVRFGYINVFYPKKKKWQVFAVTQEGYIFEVPLDLELNRSQEPPFSCVQPGHIQLAQFITIDDAPNAGTVYLAFSDERWDKSVREQYTSNVEGCRDKRMQPFNASGWFNGKTHQPHAELIDSGLNLVAEYHANAGKYVAVSAFPFTDRSAQLTDLKQSMNKLVPHKGLVFALWDPVGITMELNIEQKAAFGAAMKSSEWPVWTESAINGLKAAVQEQAEADTNRSADMMDGMTADGLAGSVIFDHGKLLGKTLDDSQARRPAEIELAREDAWKPYTLRYSEKAIESKKAELQKALDKENTETLTPLSADHSAWLQSDAFQAVFEFDYNPLSVAAGTRYRTTFLDCVGGSSDRTEALDALTKWANGSVLDRTNPLMRAMVLNNQPLAEKVAENLGTPWEELREPIGKLIEAYSKALKAEEVKLPGTLDAAYKSGARFFHELGAPIAKVVTASMDGAAGKAAVLVMSMSSGRRVVVRPVTGTTKQWIATLARQMYEMMPAKQRPSMSSLKASLSKQFQVKDDGKTTIKVPQFIIVDTDNLGQLGKGMNVNDVSSKLFNSKAPIVLTEEVVEANFVPKFKMAAQGELGFSAISAVLNLINWQYASKDLLKATEENHPEARNKVIGAIVATIGAGFQVSGNALKVAGEIRVSLAARVGATAEVLEIAGRWIGAPAAAIGVYYDWQHSTEERKKGNTVLTILYFSSSVASLALIGAALITFLEPLALPLLILLAVIGVLIMFFKERELKDWLSQSYFGVEAKKRGFPSLQAEQSGFKSVTS
jgi:hypothetical protein